MIIDLSHKRSFLRFRCAASSARLLRSLAFLAGAVFLSQTSSAQKIEMTKMVVRRSGPNIADSIESQPMSIYIVGDKYTRVELPPDPAHGRHMLVITREPDSWLINLVDHTATHLLDRGPTFISRNPIIWQAPKPGQPDEDQVFRSLEFGKEELFFSGNHGRDLGSRKVDGKNAKALAVKSGNKEVTLYLDERTGKPVQIDLTKDGKLDLSFHYDAYETGLPFEPKLFEPPSELKITEGK